MIDPGPTDLEFPVECHFRIIAENLEGMHFVIETVLLELGIRAPLETGNKSGGGKYASFAFSVVVDSLATLNRIDRELRSIEGVRMVL